jgi:hypothetical protein
MRKVDGCADNNRDSSELGDTGGRVIIEVRAELNPELRDRIGVL